jgi:hypothetical protein
MTKIETFFYQKKLTSLRLSASFYALSVTVTVSARVRTVLDSNAPRVSDLRLSSSLWRLSFLSKNSRVPPGQAWPGPGPDA